MAHGLGEPHRPGRGRKRDHDPRGGLLRGPAVSSIAVLFALACGERAPSPTASLADILAAQGAAEAFLQQDALDEARAEYQKLIELAPDAGAGYAGLGLVALRAGDLDEADTRLLEARERSPDDPSLTLALARLRFEAGAPQAAREFLTESLERDSAHARTLWALADLELEVRGPGSGERIAWLARVVDVVPGNLAAHLALAEALLRVSSLDEGLGELETLGQLAPDFPPRSRAAFDAAGDAARAGDAAAAITHLAEFRADFEVTGPYQEGLESLRPPRGELVGRPRLDFSFLRGSLRVQESEAVLAALRFTDASDLAGFGGFGAPAADDRVEPPAAFALGDFDGDDDEDLLWVFGGEARVFRVDFGRFVEPEETEPLAVADATAAIWGDFDDDRRLDAWVSGSEPRLFHNDPDGWFAEVSLPGGGTDGTAHDALFADLDQDGDLDVFEARAGPNRLYRNNGDGSFSELAAEFGLAGAADGDTRAASFADIDDDRDLDLVLADGAAGLRLLSNARGGRFEDRTDRLGGAAAGDATAVGLGDLDQDGRIDIVAAGPGGVRLLLATADGFEVAAGSAGTLELDGLVPRDLSLLDFDNDGRLDIVVAGESTDAGLHLWRNVGGGSFEIADRFLPEVPSVVRRVESMDYNEDGDADLVLLAGDGRLRLLRNDGGSANHYLRLEFVGLGDGSRKNNRFGIGARIEIRAGDLYQVHTVTDPTLLIGLDGHLKADVIRIRWPNGVPQDLYFPGTDQDLIEQQTLKGSCPLLYVWNGDGYEFVGDIMWKSALGMPLGILGGDGARAYAPGYPSQEYRRLPSGVLQPRDGEYVMHVTEELWETIYVDGVSLVAVDHPDSIDVYVNERFVPPAPTELELWRVGARHVPVSARDHRGIDRSEALAARDFDYVASFRPGRFQGLAEPHELILDLGDQAREGPVTLYLTGWIFPTDASINVAMAQSSALRSRFPALDVIGPDGEWHAALADLGFPSGKDKTVIADLAGLFPTDDRRVRIRSNLMIYWDEAFFTVGPNRPGAGEHRVTAASPSGADLHYRGFSREFRRGGRDGPHWFDYDSISVEPKWHDLEGRYTRFGDVMDLVAEGDDRYVIANAGDEITLRFDASEFPELAAGWTRTFLVYSDGWVKDGDLNTATGDRVTPFPFRAQRAYPYGPTEPVPESLRQAVNATATREVSASRYER